MNYLELTQELIDEIGTDDSAILTDVTDPPTAHIRDCVRWINKSWVSIQLQTAWRFMTEQGAFNTTPDQEGYDLRALITDPGFRRLMPYTSPHKQRWIIHDGDTPVFVFDYLDWAGRKEYLDLQAGQPQYAVIDPSDNMLLIPTPTQAKSIAFNYLRQPQRLAENADIPILPEEFHEIIVHNAGRKYAGYDEASTQYQRFEIEYADLFMQMSQEQTPNVQVRGNQ